MHKLFYPQLASSNIKKNGATYIPYILTCIFTIALFYMMESLSLNKGIDNMTGSDTIRYSMKLGCWIAAFFSVIFLFYTNSFLMKRRKKEFGLFHILGMEKKHISKVLGFETLYITIGSLGAGLLLGIVLDKVMYLLLMKVLGYSIALGFYISGKAIMNTIILYSCVFLVILLHSIRQIHSANPIELLQSSSAGEREPKTKLLMAFLGIACVGTGYTISLTSEDPVAAVFTFFIAVILVIIGTYFLFTAGSIALLKILRKNKKYYYQTKHFTSVSGMIYRMKQNAAGLASICILSTMVLVMISATASMVIGVEDIINTRYPYDLTVFSDEDWASGRNKELEEQLHSTIADANLTVKDEISYTFLSFTTLQKKNIYTADLSVNTISPEGNIINLFIIPLSDYNKVAGMNTTLEKGQALLYSNRDQMEYENIQVCGYNYQIVEHLKHFPGYDTLAANAANTQFLVVNDMEEVTYLDAAQKAVYGDDTKDIQTVYGFNMTGSKEEQIGVYNTVFELLYQKEYLLSMECKASEKDSFLPLYGGFFFVGIFLGVLFVMATVLIIYYKQISEGYDDKKRFEIMQKVGMNQTEIKKSIHSQIITVFFLPLITAGIHVAFAFPIISNILLILNLTNTSLFIVCTVVCFLLFAVLYGVIYGVTSKAYYRIVRL